MSEERRSTELDSAAPGQTLGELLKDGRAIQHLSLEDVEEQIRVRLRHLRAIEEGRYQELPYDVFALGFVRRYAKLLGLNPDVAATMFRQERAASKYGGKRTVSFKPPQPASRFRLILSTRAIVSLFVGLVVLLLFGYIWYQVRLFAAPPQLTLIQPAADMTVTRESVTVVGSTSPTASLFINNEPVPLDETGQFRQDVRLTKGVNTIEVKAVNRLGKEAIQTMHILYPQTTTPTKPQPSTPTVP